MVGSFLKHSREVFLSNDQASVLILVEKVNQNCLIEYDSVSSFRISIWFHSENENVVTFFLNN